jgi:hypothetical protein
LGLQQLFLQFYLWSIVSDAGLDQNMCDGAPVALYRTRMRVVGDAQRHTIIFGGLTAG